MNNHVLSSEMNPTRTHHCQRRREVERSCYAKAVVKSAAHSFIGCRRVNTEAPIGSCVFEELARETNAELDQQQSSCRVQITRGDVCLSRRWEEFLSTSATSAAASANVHQ